MNNSTIEMADLLGVLHRRKLALLLPFVLILGVSVSLAFGLPSIYSSSATILVEQQEIPPDLVRSTVTSYASERIHIISQYVMTRDNLIKVVKKLNLSEYNKIDHEFIVNMKKNISVDMVSADIINPQTGRASKATIAFSVSYESEHPEVARDVANEMTALFLNENLKIRKEKARTTTQFLTEEASRLGLKISELEVKLAEYKERNVGRLPQQMQLNMSLMQRSERDLEDTERQIYLQEEKKVYIEAQLAQIKPFKGTNPATRLRLLQSQYIQASATYSPDHPDLQKMKREIDILKRETGQGDDINALQKQLRGAEDNLDFMNKRYSPDHPDIVKLKRVIKTLNVAINNAEISSGSTVDVKPDNPPYITLRTQLEGIFIQIKGLKEKRSRLKEKLTLYETRIMEIPGVEQEGLSIKRDYDNAVRNYREVKENLMQAQVGEQLEKESKGERFSVIEPPRLPDTPIKPNRLGIFLLGTLISFAGGLGSATLREYMDQTIRGSRNLVSILGAHPLSVIPYKIITREKQKKKYAKWSIIGIFVLTLIVISFILVVSA